MLGVNIGKNRNTPAGRAIEDYLQCLQGVYSCADYVSVNLSSPNTPGLRDLQEGDMFDDLLTALCQHRQRLAARTGYRMPILIKIAPDLTDAALRQLTEKTLRAGLDGIIAVNTTTGRPGVQAYPQAMQAGGLSGAPLHDRCLEVVRCVRQAAGDALTIIGAGGIDSPQRAQATIEAGADLLQLYTGLVYAGPGLVRRCAAALATHRQVCATENISPPRGDFADGRSETPCAQESTGADQPSN